jgi:hypothetical protein
MLAIVTAKNRSDEKNARLNCAVPSRYIDQIATSRREIHLDQPENLTQIYLDIQVALASKASSGD